jgi:cellulose biosynthesis protein BcsQ
MKRLDLILNGKGGVGKGFFAVNFVQFLKDKGTAHMAIDSDNENSTFKRFHPDTRFIDLSNRRELDSIFSALENANLVVMDCRAASTDLFIDYFAEIDLPAVLSAMGATLTLVMPVNHESDSVDQIQRLADQFGKKCGYVVVRNAAHSESFVRVVRSAGATQKRTRRTRDRHDAVTRLAGRIAQRGEFDHHGGDQAFRIQAARPSTTPNVATEAVRRD